MSIIKQDYGVLSSDNYFPRSEANVLGAKNFIRSNNPSNTAFPYSANGVTFNYNEDGTYPVSGTASVDTILSIGTRADDGRSNLLKKGRYILSGSPIISDKVYVQVTTTKNNAAYSIATTENVKEAEFEITDDLLSGDKDYCTARIDMFIGQGQNVNGLTFKPMIRLASDPDDTYEPYAMTNRAITQSMMKEYLVQSTTGNTDNVEKVIDFPAGVTNAIYLGNVTRSSNGLWYSNHKDVQVIITSNSGIRVTTQGAFLNQSIKILIRAL